MARQQFDDRIISPTEIESLKAEEMIVTFNIASSAWKEVKSFRVNYERLRNSPSLLSELLSQTCMAVAADDVEFLRSVMRRVCSHENPCQNRVLTLNMTLVNDVNHDDDEENCIESWNSDEENQEKDDENEEACFEILEALDTVIMEGFGDQCMICLEKFEEGSESIRMRCSHLYHRNCIFQWLAKDNYSCPLCRSQVSLMV